MSDEKKVLIDVDIKATEAERNSPRGCKLQKSISKTSAKKCFIKSFSVHILLQSQLRHISFRRVDSSAH